MPTVANSSAEDPAKIKAIEEKLLPHSELTDLISRLSASTSDAGDLVRGLLQASVSINLQAELDSHLGNTPGDNGTKTTNGNQSGWFLDQ